MPSAVANARLLCWTLSVIAVCLLLGGTLFNAAYAADTILFYSSTSSIRTINLDTDQDQFQSTAPFSNSANALAVNDDAGLVYYGDGTTVYYWNPAEGNGASAHHLLDDLSVAPVQAPITNINSTGGSYHNGIYYIGSEDNNGYITGVYALSLSADGKTVQSVTSIDLLSACGCTSVQLGGFGDFTVIDEGSAGVMYGSTADLSGSGAGTSSGRWRLDLATSSWTLLSSGQGGQMASDDANAVYTNVNQQIRSVDKLTGAVGSTTLANVTNTLYDLTGAFYLDFGDAPASYGSAYHSMPGNATPVNYLGSIPPDNEAMTQHAGAGGSDGSGDNAAGSNDEDALASLSIDLNSSSYTTSMSCQGNAFVSGWLDINRNGVFDTNERNSNFPENCSGGSVTLSWSGFSGVSEGISYARIRSAGDLAEVSQPVGLATDGEVEDYQFSIAPILLTISGQVFNDRNVNGMLDAYDEPLPDVELVLYAADPGTCTTAVSAVDGSYAFTGLSAGNYTLVETAGAAAPACPPVSADPDTYLSVSANTVDLVLASSDVNAQNFADVQIPQFAAGSEQSGTPGGIAWHSHTFTAMADGTVAFTTLNPVANPANPGWRDQVYIDANCNGELDVAESTAVTSQSVLAGDTVCVLDKVFVPASVSPGAVYNNGVQATFTYADPASVSHGLQSVQLLGNQVTVGSSGTGLLVLEKTVNNITTLLGPPSASNLAAPGHVLRYTVHYRNDGTGDLHDLEITDVTPAWTSLEAPVTCTLASGNTLQGCVVDVPAAGNNQAGYSGPIKWTFNGTLSAGVADEISFDVEVE